jgi:hypothetical protein
MNNDRLVATHHVVLGLQGIVSILLMVCLADLVIYHGHGFCGYAALFVLAPLLLWSGIGRRTNSRRGSASLIFAMLLVLAARLFWSGSAVEIYVGFALTIGFAMACHGRKPYVMECLVYATQSISSAFYCLSQYESKARLAVSDDAESEGDHAQDHWLNWGLPTIALIAFGAIFVMANPDLVARFSDQIQWILRSIRRFLYRFSPTEIAFWGCVAWITTGLVRPYVLPNDKDERTVTGPETTRSRFYPAYRNTLYAVVGLFAIYLVFEFQTLWFREFPKGFYYAGYAHQGAAWLTIALGLATLLLSIIFRGSVLTDDRLGSLQQAAWVWSALNFVLAIAVYNRMLIYINYNGMTRMRTIGLFGISTVVAGFIFVVIKITRQFNFTWLIRRQLWALFIAVFLYAITPVDMIVHRYNVNRILAGDPSPSVQISVHPISSEGYMVLDPLQTCDDPIIRDGIRAMRLERQQQLESNVEQQTFNGWTAFQLADRWLLEQFRETTVDKSEFMSEAKRKEALSRFHKYAWQWY